MPILVKFLVYMGLLVAPGAHEGCTAESKDDVLLQSSHRKTKTDFQHKGQLDEDDDDPKCDDPETQALSAYFDSGDCGPVGDDHNFELCGGDDQGECPEFWEGKNGDIIRFGNDVESRHKGLSERVGCLKARLKKFVKSKAFKTSPSSPYDTGEEGVIFKKCDTMCQYWWHAQYECVLHKIAVHRKFFKGDKDHFYTPNSAEDKGDGTDEEGIAGYIYAEKQPGTVALHRSYIPSWTDHFYTTNKEEATRGATWDHPPPITYEGILGYIFPKKKPGTVALYRSFIIGWKDHMYSTDKAEHDGCKGCKYEGIVGYIFPK